MIEDLSGKSGNAGNGYGLSSKSKENLELGIVTLILENEMAYLLKREENRSWEWLGCDSTWDIFLE